MCHYRPAIYIYKRPWTSLTNLVSFISAIGAGFHCTPVSLLIPNPAEFVKSDVWLRRCQVLNVPLQTNDIHLQETLDFVDKPRSLSSQPSALDSIVLRFLC